MSNVIQTIRSHALQARASGGIYPLSEEDQEIMDGIKVQCPFSGGKAVYKVRAYLAILGDTTIYDDETVCIEV